MALYALRALNPTVSPKEPHTIIRSRDPAPMPETLNPKLTHFQFVLQNVVLVNFEV